MLEKFTDAERAALMDWAADGQEEPGTNPEPPAPPPDPDDLLDMSVPAGSKAVPYKYGKPGKKRVRYGCPNCKFDTDDPALVDDHHYYRHVMEAVQSRNGQVTLRKRTPKATLYGPDNQLITEVETSEARPKTV